MPENARKPIEKNWKQYLPVLKLKKVQTGRFPHALLFISHFPDISFVLFKTQENDWRMSIRSHCKPKHLIRSNQSKETLIYYWIKFRKKPWSFLKSIKTNKKHNNQKLTVSSNFKTPKSSNKQVSTCFSLFIRDTFQTSFIKLKTMTAEWVSGHTVNLLYSQIKTEFNKIRPKQRDVTNDVQKTIKKTTEKPGINSTA